MAEYTKSEARQWAEQAVTGQWSTLMTPFTNEDQINEEGIRKDIQHVRKLGSTGAGCTWGMGEFWSLTMEERLKVYDIVADESAGQWPIAAHVSHTSEKDVLKLASHAEKVGFDLLVIAAPYFVTNQEKQVVEWVKYLADNSNLAIMYYNSPQFGIIMSVDGLQEICDIPTVVGVKEASFNPEISIAAHTRLGNNSIISTPDEWIFHKGKELGFQQKVMFANTSDWRFDTEDANYYVQFINKAIDGDIDIELYQENIAPIKSVSDKWWQYTVKKMNGALPASLCKYWGELMGMSGGSVRKPLIDLSEKEKTDLRNDIAEVRHNMSIPL
jgi:4-hydroxy-tetrahydrodipicolinate synthase